MTYFKMRSDLDHIYGIKNKRCIFHIDTINGKPTIFEGKCNDKGVVTVMRPFNYKGAKFNSIDVEYISVGDL